MDYIIIFLLVFNIISKFKDNNGVVKNQQLIHDRLIELKWEIKRLKK